VPGHHGNGEQEGGRLGRGPEARQSNGGKKSKCGDCHGGAVAEIWGTMFGVGEILPEQCSHEHAKAWIRKIMRLTAAIRQQRGPVALTSYTPKNLDRREIKEAYL
ncbi:MAG TPA: hypothetical protein VJP83_11935, partial [Terriglobales bacterium]|nr:hypothetical protein [Terriglobales bacterium]